MPGWPHLPPKTVAQLPHTLTQQCNKFLTDYNGMPHVHPQNCPFPQCNHHPHLLGSRQPTTQTAFRSNQPFCHNTPDRHTHKRDRPISPIPTPVYSLLIIETRVIIQNMNTYYNQSGSIWHPWNYSNHHHKKNCCQQNDIMAVIKGDTCDMRSYKCPNAK